MLSSALGRHIIRFSSIALVIMLVLGSLATPARAYFVPSTHPSATLVLGQSNFTSAASATTQTGMLGPFNVAVDPLTHKVFVADTSNSRVLRFASVFALASGDPAEAVLGQPGFTTSSAAASQSGMSMPGGVFVDSAGRLWVADTDNNRVLRFDNAASKTNGASADGVLGQPNFTSSAFATARGRMWSPFDARVDAAGRLWVADAYNNRVLRFDKAASKANGANADAVLGQAGFTTDAFGTTQNRMHFPYGVSIDSAGRLWIADALNNRVLRFNNAAAKPNGGNADGVLGQPNFTTGGVAVSRTGMNFPTGLVIDNSTGRLYVADFLNSRVLVYNSAAGLPNGANASFVLGQPNFTTGTFNTGGLSASSMYYPWGVFYDPFARLLWVSDTNNNRVLLFGRPSSFVKSKSMAVDDGWVLESTEISSKGGTALATGSLRLGDNALNRQYRSVVSFDTSALPDTGITVRSAVLKIRKATVVGSDPLLSFGPLLGDIKMGTFGTEALQIGDFQALPSAAAIGRFRPVGGGWFALSVPAADLAFVNRAGLTQFRLRFSIDDNNNHIADFDTFFSGDALTAANRPLLIVEYTMP